MPGKRQMRQRVRQSHRSERISWLPAGCVSFPRSRAFRQAEVLGSESEPRTPTSASPQAAAMTRLAMVVLWLRLALWSASGASDDAPDEPVLKPDVVNTIESWRPKNPSAQDVADLPVVLPVVRRWVAATAPGSASTTMLLMRATTGLALWGWRDLGTLKAEVLLHVQNVEYWSMTHPRQQKRSVTWRHNTRGNLRRVGKTVNAKNWPLPAHSYGRSSDASALHPRRRADIHAGGGHARQAQPCGPSVGGVRQPWSGDDRCGSRAHCAR